MKIGMSYVLVLCGLLMRKTFYFQQISDFMIGKKNGYMIDIISVLR